MLDESIYEGREQTFVKHFVLEQYLERFAHIIGSKWPSITYIDTFAGPWESRTADLADTSFAIAVEQLRLARRHLAERGVNVPNVRCFFIEKDRSSFDRLAQFASTVSEFEIEVKCGPLKDHVNDIVEFLRREPRTFAFTFIDPTGWTGFDLDLITPLLRWTPNEVLINFMTKDIRRFVDSEPESQIAPSFKKLYGDARYLNDIKERSADRSREDALVDTYADRIRARGSYTYISRATILHPKKDVTHFHLVYATRNRRGIDVFKEIERKAMRAMESMRLKLKATQDSSSLELFPAQEISEVPMYSTFRDGYLYRARAQFMKEVLVRGSVPYERAWEIVISHPMCWESDLKKWIVELGNENLMTIEGLSPGERVPKLDRGHMLVWKGGHGSTGD